jgi:hypothetical protein
MAARMPSNVDVMQQLAYMRGPSLAVDSHPQSYSHRTKFWKYPRESAVGILGILLRLVSKYSTHETSKMNWAYLQVIL